MGGKAHVEIFSCGENLMCGKVVAVNVTKKADGAPDLDTLNKDKSLRSRTILGIQLISNMKFKKDGIWTRGKIYNPEDGNTYSSSMRMIDNDTLKLNGCVFILCKSEIWIRIK